MFTLQCKYKPGDIIVLDPVFYRDLGPHLVVRFNNPGTKYVLRDLNPESKRFNNETYTYINEIDNCSRLVNGLERVVKRL